MLSVIVDGADLRFLQFKTYDNSVVFLFILFFVVVILITLIIAYRMMVRQRKLEEHSVLHQFRENCRRFNFDSGEIEAVTQAVSRMVSLNSNDIFEVQNVYERAIHDNIESAIDNGANCNELDIIYGSIRKKLHYVLLPDGVALTSTRSMSTGHPVSLVDLKCEARLIQNQETFFVLKCNDDAPVLIQPQSTLRIAFARSNDGLYAADIRVIDCVGGKIKCRHTITLKRHQLRKDVRMRMTGKVKLYMRDSENNRISFDARLIDISAGGFCFESPITIPVKAVVIISSCTLPVEVNGVRAVIIASSKREKDDELINKYHASYIDIPFDKRERIVSYLFVKMREMQKK